MPNPFARTSRSLTSDTSRYALMAWALVSILLGAWLVWFFFVKITVYEVSMAARLQVERSAHPVATLIAGKIMISHMYLGQHVETGDVLVELDVHTERLRLQEEHARLKAIPPQLEALERQIADQEKAAERGRAAAVSATEHAQWRYKEALSEAKFAQENLSRLAKLDKSGQITEIKTLRARADADVSRLGADALAAEIDRQIADAFSQDYEKRAALEAVRREVANLNGQIELLSATIARLTQGIEKHLIRAPISGEIGEVASLSVGSFVDTGKILGRIVPSGELKVVADFEPARVLGRVYPAQSARMRLDGFPWAQYGSIAVKVHRVASEIRDGRVRVEFLPDATDDPNPLLQHGLPGTVEIEIEQTTPALLVLRAAGQMLAQSVQPPVSVAKSNP